MSTIVLPELAAESVETAERLVRLSTEEGLDPAEAEYILYSGFAALQRVCRLWPIIRARIGAGMAGPAAHEHLARLLDAVDKNLALAATLKQPARVVREASAREPEIALELAATEEQLRQVRAEAVRLLSVVDAPAPWPARDQLGQAKDRIHAGERLTADQFRQVLLTSKGPEAWS